MEITRELINSVVKKIIENVGPDMVILFGSFATGHPTADSDLDLLIVKHSNLRRDKRALEIDELFSNRNFPLDIIVYTPEEVEKFRDIEGSFIKDILKSGEILYERAA